MMAEPPSTSIGKSQNVGVKNIDPSIRFFQEITSTLGKFALSGPQFPYLDNGAYDPLYLLGLGFGMDTALSSASLLLLGGQLLPVSTARHCCFYVTFHSFHFLIAEYLRYRRI